MDDLTYGDLERIRVAEKARVSASIEVLGPVMEEAIRMMQSKPDPVADRKHWRRIYAAHAMHGEIMSQGLEGRDVANIAAMAHEMADAMLACEDQEVPCGPR